jgi:hypothetical protein
MEHTLEAPPFSLYLDRIEGEIAVLLVGEKPPFFVWHVPCTLLPTGAVAGERLTCLLRRDAPATAEAVARNAAIRKDL